MLLYELSQSLKQVRNEDVFSLLRLALTGTTNQMNMATAPPAIGDICEILGRETVVKRVEKLKDYIKLL